MAALPATKLAAPVPSIGLVPRPRLVELLDGAVRRPFTLVSAPAGSGKTALLAEWVAQGSAPGPVAWLSLGPEEADRRQFWSHAVAAAGQACPELAGLAVPPNERIDGFLVQALNELTRLQRPLVMVLDDLHLVSGSEVLADLDRLLESPSAGLRLIAATRSDPLLRLQRLRVAGTMAEIRAGELRFELEEAEELLRGLGLAREDLELLWRRTEGWATGLRLAELSLEREPDPHAFITSFAGNNRAVSDYLMAEVVARLPDGRLDFLMRTAIVRQVDGDLADALTGRLGGAHELRELAGEDGFVSEVAGGAGWYRYHPLFREVVRAEARRRIPDELPELNRLASRWHAERGNSTAAIRHAIDARDWALAAELVGERWLVLVVRGHGATLLELVRSIPHAVVDSEAELALAKAGMLLETGDAGAADQLLARATELAPGLSPPRARRFAVAATALDLYRARLGGDLDRALSAARQVLEEPWERTLAVEVRALTLANVGIAEFWAAGTEEAGQHLQQAAGLALECGNDFVHFLAECYAAAIDARDGRLDGAWKRARTAIQLAERRGWTRVAHAAIAYSTLATLHLWRNELPQAREAAASASATVARAGDPLLAATVAVVRARLRALDGDPVGAMDVLHVATANGPLPAFLGVSAALTEADLWLALGEPGRSRKRLVELGDEAGPDPLVGLARLELAAGDPAAALTALERFLEDGREPLLPFARTEARLLDAIARDALRDEDGALASMERALDLAEPRGYENVLLRYGPPLRSLLRRLVARGTAHRAFADGLLAALGAGPGPAARSSVRPLLEPLSERELAVLRYLPTMMSNAEIAGEMYVSVNTVKTHLKHVYRKLDVVDRRECVRRARELHLLGAGLGER